MNKILLGHVYIARHKLTNYCKIGRSKEPEKRIDELERLIGFRFDDVYISDKLKNMSKVENYMHKFYDKNKIIAENFDIDFNEAVERLKKIAIVATNEDIELSNKLGLSEEDSLKYLSKLFGEYLTGSEYFLEYIKTVFGTWLIRGDDGMEFKTDIIVVDFENDNKFNIIYWNKELQEFCYSQSNDYFYGDFVEYMPILPPTYTEKNYDIMFKRH